jgi:hypothetical protein
MGTMQTMVFYLTGRQQPAPGRTLRTCAKYLTANCPIGACQREDRAAWVPHTQDFSVACDEPAVESVNTVMHGDEAGV